MNIPNVSQLVLLIWNIESVLSAPPHMEVTVWERNFDGLGRVTTVGKLRRALEGSTYSADFGGWLFVFPDEEPYTDGCYQGWYAGSTFRIEITNIDYEI
jgi:hypothetical protein